MSAVPFWRYPVWIPFGGIQSGYLLAVSRVGATLLAVLRVGATFWRYLELAVLFLAEAVKPKHGGILSAVMQYGGNVLAGGGF